MIYVVINPKAGNGRGMRIWRKIEESLRKHDVDYEAILTRSAGQAAEWCRSFIETYKEGQLAGEELVTLVIVGGDGTLNEAAQGLMTGTGGKPVDERIRLSFIPAGSGNDFARGHGIPLRAEQAMEQLLDALRSSRQDRIDLLEVNGQFALSSIGVGLDGEVAYTANRAPYKPWMNRLRLGFAAYILSLLRVLLFFKPSDAELIVDGRRVKLRRAWLIAVTNIPQYGGGMKINPDAIPNDGLADVCVVSGVSRSGLLAAFPKVYSGRHIDHPAVTFYRGTTIHIIPQHSLRIHVDGEQAGDSPAQIRLIPQAISIVK